MQEIQKTILTCGLYHMTISREITNLILESVHLIDRNGRTYGVPGAANSLWLRTSTGYGVITIDVAGKKGFEMEKIDFFMAQLEQNIEELETECINTVGIIPADILRYVLIAVSKSRKETNKKFGAVAEG